MASAVEATLKLEIGPETMAALGDLVRAAVVELSANVIAAVLARQTPDVPAARSPDRPAARSGQESAAARDTPPQPAPPLTSDEALAELEQLASVRPQPPADRTPSPASPFIDADPRQTDLEEFIDQAPAPDRVRLAEAALGGRVVEHAGSYLVPAETVARLGDGGNEAGTPQEHLNRSDSDAESWEVMFTPERNAIVMRGFPLGYDSGDLRRICEHLRGRPIPKNAYIGIKANKMGLARPRGFNRNFPKRISFDKGVEWALQFVMSLPEPETPTNKNKYDTPAKSAEICQKSTPDPATVAKPAPPKPPPAPEKPVSFVRPGQPKPNVVAAYQPPPPRPAAAAAPRPAAAPAEPLPFRTAEREERLCSCVRLGDDHELIARVLNTFPGGKFTVAEVRAWIDDLGLGKPPGLAPEPAEKISGVRERVFKSSYVLGDSFAQILQKMRALPGPALTIEDLHKFEKACGLKRAVEPVRGGTASEKLCTDFNSAVAWARKNSVRLAIPMQPSNKQMEDAVNQARSASACASGPSRIPAATRSRSRRKSGVERDGFLHREIAARAAPSFPLPADVVVACADYLGRGTYAWNSKTYRGVGRLCVAMRARTKATHLQVHDATDGRRVPMTFMSIADTAKELGASPK